MLDLANPYLLNLLWLIVVFYAAYYIMQMRKRRNLAKFGNAETIKPLMPDASIYKPALKFVLRMIALAAIVMLLVRPRSGAEVKDETSAGIEVMVAFDLSNSMLASATDDVNAASRLDRARLLLDKLINRLDNDKVGMVIFAGTAKTQFPLTGDFGIAKMYLSDLHPSMMAYQGTSISEAISMAANGFSADENINKAIILITDSEDHEGAAVDAANAAAEKGIQVNVVGLGSPNGAPIPDPNRKGQYMTDMNGETVRTTLNAELAQQIAEAGKGVFVNGAASDALDVLSDRLDNLQKSQFKRARYTSGAEQFPLFAWIALLFLVLDCMISDSKNTWLGKFNFFSSQTSRTKQDKQ